MAIEFEKYPLKANAFKADIANSEKLGKRGQYYCKNSNSNISFSQASEKEGHPVSPSQKASLMFHILVVIRLLLNTFLVFGECFYM